MTIMDLDIPQPSGIAPESLKNPKLVIAGQGPKGDCLCVYCPVNKCGGVYWLSNKVWFLVMPVDPTFFVSSLQVNGVTLPDPVKAALWRTEVLSHTSHRDPPH